MSFEFEFGIFTHEVSHTSHPKFGRCVKEAWTKNDVLHREDGPATLYRDKSSGKIIQEEYYRGGKLHREDGPAKTTHFEGVTTEECLQNGDYHRADGPAIRQTLENGIVRLEEWVTKGQSHRVGQPSFITRDEETGEIVSESWHLDGEAHRVGGPSTVGRDKTTGIVTEEYWKQNGNYYRENGEPTCITRNGKTGEITYEGNPETDENSDLSVKPGDTFCP